MLAMLLRLLPKPWAISPVRIGVTQHCHDAAGLEREELYNVLIENGNPEFATLCGKVTLDDFSFCSVRFPGRLLKLLYTDLLIVFGLPLIAALERKL